MVQIQDKLYDDNYVGSIFKIFGDLSNDYVFDHNSVIRRINPPKCEKCGHKMVHNGHNSYSRKNLGSLRIGKYKCPNCNSNIEESKSSWINLLSEVKDYYGLFTLKCLEQNVSYEGIAEISEFIIPRGKDFFEDLAKEKLSEIELPPINFEDDILIIHYDEQHPKRKISQKKKRNSPNEFLRPNIG